eukprot:Colp12_sorted_trinity150504_noHs@18713
MKKFKKGSKDTPDSPSSTASTPSQQRKPKIREAVETVVEEVFENERYQPVMGWGGSYPGHLLPTDRGNWSDRYGNPPAFHPHKQEAEGELTLGWHWIDEWTVDKTYTGCDDDGWSYATDFLFLDRNLQRRSSIPEAGLTDFVRRRRWIRSRQRKINIDETDPCPAEGVLDPEKQPFPRGPLDGGDGVHMWSEPAAETFDVRGPTYHKDKKKQKSAPATMHLLDVDLYMSDKRQDNFGTHPDSYVQKSLRNGDTRFKVVINFQAPPHHMAITYAMKPPADLGKDTAFNLVWERFLDGDDAYRNTRFKVIPRIVEGNMLVKKTVGSKPAILGMKLLHRYFKTDTHFEIDCDIYAAAFTSMLVGVVKGYASAFAIDMGFCVEGKTNDELPERLFGTIRVWRPHLDRFRPLNEPEPADDDDDTQSFHSANAQ